jgi:hypothetical protein
MIQSTLISQFFILIYNSFSIDLVEKDKTELEKTYRTYQERARSLEMQLKTLEEWKTHANAELEFCELFFLFHHDYSLFIFNLTRSIALRQVQIYPRRKSHCWIDR